MTRELEVKILNIDPTSMEKKIIELGGKLIGREKQTNTLLDSDTRPIKSYMDAYLRIREATDLISGDGFAELTLKKKLKNSSLRENVELNVRIDDSKTMLTLLMDLGFNKVSVGIKDRTSYLLKGARLDIDVWDQRTYPFPYMEIEVDNEVMLREIVELLEIIPEDISTLSIVELQDKLKGELDA